MTLSLSRRIERLEAQCRPDPQAAWDAARREVLLMLADPEARRLASKVAATLDGTEAAYHEAAAALDARLMELMEDGGT